MAGSSHFNALCQITIHTVNGEDVAMGVGTDYPFVTSVQVTRVFERSSDISVTLEAPFREGREMMNSDLFHSGNKITIRMSYPDDSKAQFEVQGVILKGGVGLSVTPNGISGSLSVRGTSITSEQKKPMVQPGENYDAFVWLKAVVVEAGYVDLIASERIKNDLSIIDTQFNGANSLEGHLEDFCMMNGFRWVENYDMDRGGNIIEILDDEEIDIKPVSRIFVMRDSFMDTAYLANNEFIKNAGAEKATAYPIISYSPELTGGFFANTETKKASLRGIDGDGKTETEDETAKSVRSVKQGIKGGDSSDGTEDQQAGGTTTVKAVDEKTTGEVISPLYPETKDREVDKKRLVRVMSRNLISYNASLTTFGVPDLVPSERIAVVGLGALLDGIFTVKEVTQVWSAGKIDTTIGIYGRTNGVDA